MELPAARSQDGGAAEPRRHWHPWWVGSEMPALLHAHFHFSHLAGSSLAGADLQRRIVQHAPELLQQLHVSAETSAHWRLYKCVNV
jgi:hypothetical protein